jgi:hypothetical protein|tara:strand:- start:168 stop:308 length:141 start_codon:yes stop_codon:yes gene_type:complete
MSEEDMKEKAINEMLMVGTAKLFGASNKLIAFQLGLDLLNMFTKKK